MEIINVQSSFNNERLDIVLAKHEKVPSRSQAQKLIKSGRARINNVSRKLSPKTKVWTGDIITFSIISTSADNLVPVKHNLNIIFEDPYLIVVDKPRGMVVHPAAGHDSDTLVNYLLYHSRLSNGHSQRPGIVHRLDKDTSGLLVAAKDNDTHEKLAQQFKERKTGRKYQAIIWGVPKTEAGTIDEPLGRHPVNRKKMSLRPNGKKAVTHWRALKKFKYLSLLECRLETGRTHQIRVHLNSMGHPVLGDPVYGKFRRHTGKIWEKLEPVLKEQKGQALHAETLSFEHPQTKEWKEFGAPVPPDMRNVLSALENQE